jgi:hypothetical protein
LRLFRVLTKHEIFIGGITMSANTMVTQPLQNTQVQPPVQPIVPAPVQSTAQPVPQTTTTSSALPGRILSTINTSATAGWNWVQTQAQPAVSYAQGIASRVNTYVSSKWQEVSTAIQTKATEWDAKLVQWSDLYIGTRYAPIFRRAIYSLPVTLTMFCIPSQIFWGAIGAYAITHAVAKNKDLLPSHAYRLIHDGLGFGGVVSTVLAVAQFIWTRQPEPAVSIILSTAWATFWFTRSVTAQEATTAATTQPTTTTPPPVNVDHSVVQPTPTTHTEEPRPVSGPERHEVVTTPETPKRRRRKTQAAAPVEPKPQPRARRRRNAVN